MKLHCRRYQIVKLERHFVLLFITFLPAVLEVSFSVTHPN